MPLEFPYDILKPRSVRPDIIGGVISGGLSNSGQQQIVNATGGGLWAVTMDGFTIRTPEQIRAWRMIQYGSQSGVVPVNISICQSATMPVSGVPHSDFSPFGDGSLYRTFDVQAQTVASAPLRATSLTVAFAGGAQPLGGEIFSIEYDDGYHSLHAITDVEPSGSNYVLSFVTPLRAAVASGVSLQFKHPKITTRLASADAMSMAVTSGRFASPSAVFVEHLRS